MDIKTFFDDHAKNIKLLSEKYDRYGFYIEEIVGRRALSRWINF